MVIGALLDGAGQLGDGDDGHVEVAGYRFQLASDVAQFLHAVVAPVFAPGYELQIVHDHEIEASAGVEAAEFGAHLQHGLGGGVVHIDGEVGEGADAGNHAGLRRFAEQAEPQEVAVNLRLGGEEAERELLAAHLQTNHADDGALARGVARDIHRKR